MDEILAHHVDVVLEHGRDGDNGGGIRDGPRHEPPDLLVLRQCRVRLDQIDLVLEYDDVLEAHNLHGGQVLRGLGLGARLVPGHEEEGGVHDGGAVEHGRHENVVAGAVDEGDVAAEAVGDSRLVVGKDVGVGRAAGGVESSQLLIFDGLLCIIACAIAVLLGGEGIALVDLGVGVSQFDGNVPLQLVLEADGLYARDGLHDRTLAVGDVTDRADVDGGLPADLRAVCRFGGGASTGGCE
mmetsp:Transcript_30724/g.92012  ORF Transcript_30724/g.92012 Transcript_30724/m.92012 type:complete len:240 (+) Transcript_30724:1019-1738(+)